MFWRVFFFFFWVGVFGTWREQFLAGLWVIFLIIEKVVCF